MFHSVPVPVEEEKIIKIKTRTDNGFKTSVYQKTLFAGQELNFNPPNQGIMKNNIVSFLQRSAKVINSDTDKYQKEMTRMMLTIQNNTYPVNITSASSGGNEMVKEENQKTATSENYSEAGTLYGNSSPSEA